MNYRNAQQVAEQLRAAGLMLETVKRTQGGVPGSPGKLIPVIVFEDTPARYKLRFKFYEAATAVVRREWDRQFADAFAEAMRSAR